jgi:hypothetical protein
MYSSLPYEGDRVDEFIYIFSNGFDPEGQSVLFTNDPKITRLEKGKVDINPLWNFFLKRGLCR